MRRPTLRSIAKWALGVVLLAQAALAAQACAMPVHRPAAAFSSDAAHSECEGKGPSVHFPCLVHCLQWDQAADSTQDHNFVPPATDYVAQPAAWRQLAALPAGMRSPGSRQDPATGPPVYLRFPCLRM